MDDTKRTVEVAPVFQKGSEGQQGGGDGVENIWIIVLHIFIDMLVKGFVTSHNQHVYNFMHMLVDDVV